MRWKCVPANPGALVGVALFLGGIALPALLPVPASLQRPAAWLPVCMAGLLLAALSLLVAARRHRRHWLRVRARCLEQRIVQETGGGPDSGKSWAVHLVCEVDLHGCPRRVEPTFWRTFATRGGAARFLGRRIGPDGCCGLHVDPDDPRRAEIAGGDIAEWLLYRR